MQKQQNLSHDKFFNDIFLIEGGIYVIPETAEGKKYVIPETAEGKKYVIPETAEGKKYVIPETAEGSYPGPNNIII